MSTATKLTYLNDTKGLLKDSINNLGGNLTSQSTFRSYASELDSIYENLPKVSGTGSALSLSPTIGGKLRINGVYGDTLQNGTPTPDSPIPIECVTGNQSIEICGKNMLDKSYFQNGSIDANTGQNVSNNQNGRGNNYIPVLPNTTYTISCNTNVDKLRLSEYTINKTNIQRDSTSNQNKLTITTTANTRYLRWSLNYNASTTVTQQIIDSLDLQLEKGTATTYEPYNGNTYEVNLGKNLLNILDETKTSGNITVVSSNGIITLNGSDISNKFINYDLFTLSAGTYTLSANNSDTLTSLDYLRLVDENGSSISGLTIALNTANASVTFTLEEDKIIKLQIRINANTSLSDFILKPQLEKGTAATSFSPYFTPIELNKIGNYEDYIFKNEPSSPLYDDTLTLNSWYITKNIGKVVLDGTENWATQRDTSPYVFRTLNNDYKRIEENTCICDHFVSTTNGGYGDLTDKQIKFRYSTNDNNKYLYICTTVESTYSGFKTWLSTHNTEVKYVLKTPIYEAITNEELIEQLKSLYNAKSKNGTTNIVITSNDLPMIISVNAIKGES